MKIWRILAILLLCLVLIGTTSCESLTGEQEEEDRMSEVFRGDLVITVSGTGNIEVSSDRQLSFEVSGKIDELYVEEGDEVKEGDILGKLEIDSLELAVTQAEVAVTQAELAITQAQIAVTQAQYNIDAAEYDLKYTQDLHLWTEISAAQGEVADAEDYLESALTKLAQTPTGTDSEEAWQKTVFYAEQRLNTAKNRVDAMLAGTDTELLKLKKQQIELSEQTLEQAQQSEELARQAEQLARQSLAQAEKQLGEATVTAPFDGIVTDVYTEEKDIVTPAVPVFRLIDVTRMELNVDVDEVDIAEVKVGQDVIIELDALLEVTVNGKVSYIHELPRKEGGVILYRVKIEFDFTGDIGIRSGMSANADIIIEKRSNVLIVPSRAIQQNSQGEMIVEIPVDKQFEERLVVTGISDGYQTEIIDGLAEGEIVVERRNR